MRDVVLSTSDVVFKTTRSALSWNGAVYANSGSNCFTSDNSDVPHVNIDRAAGRSDLITSDHIRPTYYHRYDLNFRPGTVPAGILLDISDGIKCYRSWQVPKLQWFKILTQTRESKIGMSTWDVQIAGQVNGFWEPSVPAAVIDAAKSKALSNARNDVADLGEAMGEAAKTASLLAENVKTLAKALNYARKKNWRGMRQELGITKGTAGKTASNRWLEYQYGWKPLVSDIISLVDDSGAAFGRGGYFTAKGHSSDTVVNNGFECERGCEIGFTYKVIDPTALGMLSYGLSNPLLASWNLMRYSFLIDWVLPIGKYLQALGGVRGTEYVSGYRTLYTRGNGTYDLTRFGVTAGCDGRTFAMQRTVELSTPTPGVALSLKFSPTKALNALALLNQRR